MEIHQHEIGRHLIKSIEAKELKKRSLALRFADELTTFFGSIPFFILNAVVFSSWVLINTGKIPGIPIFDPFPFSMLTTVVSLEAIILTIIVLMSQGRQSLISSLREEIDIQVNLIAEREITKILQLLNEYLKASGVKIEDPELESMLKEVDASYIERKLEAELTGSKPPSVVHEVTKPIMSIGKEFEKVTNPLRRVRQKIEN